MLAVLSSLIHPDNLIKDLQTVLNQQQDGNLSEKKLSTSRCWFRGLRCLCQFTFQTSDLHKRLSTFLPGTAYFCLCLPVLSTRKSEKKEEIGGRRKWARGGGGGNGRMCEWDKEKKRERETTTTTTTHKNERLKVKERERNKDGIEEEKGEKRQSDARWQIWKERDGWFPWNHYITFCTLLLPWLQSHISLIIRPSDTFA